MRKIFREIRRLAPGAKVSVNGRNHYEVRLINGALVVISGTPSDQRFMKNVRADVRRQSKKSNLRSNP